MVKGKKGKTKKKDENPTKIEEERAKTSPPPFSPNPCPFCLSPVPPIFVHGHLQCQSCGMNVEACCSGDALDPSAEK